MKRRPSVTVLSIVLLALVALLIILLCAGPWLRLETPPVILPDAVTGQQPEAPADSDLFHKADVTPETVQAVIASLDRETAYSRTVTVRTYWQDVSSAETISEQTLDGCSRLHSGTKNMLIRPDGLWIWYDNATGIYHCAAADAGYAQADTWLRTLTYEHVLELPQTAITGAGYMLFNGTACIYAEYTAGELGYLNRIYVGVTTGLLMGCETYDGDTLIYSMTSDAPSLTAPAETLFLPPA